MIKFAFALLASASAVLATPALAATTYTSGTTSVGTNGSYTLSITTDGTIGALTSSDITDFLITISDSHGTVTLTPGNTGVDIDGGLSATSTGLMFDFGSNGFALFQNPFITSGQNFLCFAGSTCGNYSHATNLLVGSNFAELSTSPMQGNVVIASAAPAGAVPEPETWAMMLLGFSAIGLVTRRRRRSRLTQIA